MECLVGAYTFLRTCVHLQPAVILLHLYIFYPSALLAPTILGLFVLPANFCAADPGPSGC